MINEATIINAFSQNDIRATSAEPVSQFGGQLASEREDKRQIETEKKTEQGIDSCTLKQTNMKRHSLS